MESECQMETNDNFESKPKPCSSTPDSESLTPPGVAYTQQQQPQEQAITPQKPLNSSTNKKEEEVSEEEVSEISKEEDIHKRHNIMEEDDEREEVTQKVDEKGRQGHGFCHTHDNTHDNTLDITTHDKEQCIENKYEMTDEANLELNKSHYFFILNFKLKIKLKKNLEEV